MLDLGGLGEREGRKEGGEGVLESGCAIASQFSRKYQVTRLGRGCMVKENFGIETMVF